jgi:CBS domain-containing protein
MNVSGAMRTDVKTIPPTSTFADAGAVLREHNISSIVVVEGGDPVGIITERDFVGVVADGLDPASTFVGDRMTRDLVTVEAEMPISEAASLMKERGIRHLPVVEGDRFVGIVSIRDLLVWAADHDDVSLEYWPDLVAAVAAEWPH